MFKLRALGVALTIVLMLQVGVPHPARASEVPQREAGQRELLSEFLLRIEPPILPDGSANSGVLVFAQDPTVTVFSNTWMASRSGGRRHLGTDLMAPKLSPVYALAGGVVTRLSDGRRSGPSVTILHGGGVESTYMHLNNDTPGTDDGLAGPRLAYAPGIEVGARVEAGSLIGFVGDSGNAERTGSHTHVEIRVQGRSVNPYPILRAAWDTWALAQRTAEVGALLATPIGSAEG